MYEVRLTRAKSIPVPNKQLNGRFEKINKIYIVYSFKSG